MHSVIILNAIKKFCYLMFVDICTHKSLSNSVSENVIIFNTTTNNSAFCNFHATEGQSRYLIFLQGIYTGIVSQSHSICGEACPYLACKDIYFCPTSTSYLFHLVRRGLLPI